MSPVVVPKGHLFKFTIDLLHPEAPEPAPPDSARLTARNIAVMMRLVHPTIAARILRGLELGKTEFSLFPEQTVSLFQAPPNTLPVC